VPPAHWRRRRVRAVSALPPKLSPSSPRRPYLAGVVVGGRRRRSGCELEGEARRPVVMVVRRRAPVHQRAGKLPYQGRAASCCGLRGQRQERTGIHLGRAGPLAAPNRLASALTCGCRARPSRRPAAPAPPGQTGSGWARGRRGVTARRSAAASAPACAAGVVRAVARGRCEWEGGPAQSFAPESGGGWWRHPEQRAGNRGSYIARQSKQAREKASGQRSPAE
jgi:hypothetical protein